MKELLDAMCGNPPCPGGGIKITLDIDLSQMMAPKPPCPEMMAKKAEMLEEHPELIDKKIDMLEDLKANSENSHELLGNRGSEIEPGGQTISFMGPCAGENKPCPEMGLGGFSDDLIKMIKSLGPQDWDGQGFKKEKVEVYPEDSSDSDFGSDSKSDSDKFESFCPVSS